MDKYLPKNSRGFSMIEFMIVVGVISALTAVALPKFFHYRELAHMREAKVVLEALYNLERSKMPKGGFVTVGSKEHPCRFDVLSKNLICGSKIVALNEAGSPPSSELKMFGVSHFRYYVEIKDEKFTAYAVTGSGEENTLCNQRRESQSALLFFLREDRTTNLGELSCASAEFVKKQ
jgi:prepilin-type N-terminal cleavage/methylation domain-containing protein